MELDARTVVVSAEVCVKAPALMWLADPAPTKPNGSYTARFQNEGV